MPQTPEKFICEARVVALGEEVEPQNDMYLSLKMVFLTSEVNLNSIEFQADFIEGVVDAQEKFITMPIVVDVANLLAGKYDKLTHKYSKGKFGTQIIGGFYKFETNKNGNVLELIAYGRVWKRNEKVVAALEEIYGTDEGLKFSYEILVGKYTSENGIKKVPKDDLNNPIGSCVVSTPAVPAAKALLIAEACEHDFIDNIQEGGVEMPKVRDANRTVEDMFAETKTYFESADLDLSQIRKKIYSNLQDVFKSDWYNYDITHMFLTYVIVQNWNSGDYYKITFTTTDSEVTLFEPVKVTITFVETANKEEEEKMATIAELEVKVKDLETQIASKDTIIADKDKLISEKETALATKETELTTANENINTLSASVLEKDKQIETLQASKIELDTIKTEQEKVLQAEKKTALKEKYGKLLPESVMAETEIAEAIENLDEKVLSERVVKVALEKAEKDVKEPKTDKKVTLASRITDNIELSGSEPNSLRAKYSL
jgi:hypothetical protein